jgi:hypothetical protein
VSVIWNLPIALGTYFGLGAVVLASRLIFPKSKSVAVNDAPASAPEQQELAKAA